MTWIFASGSDIQKSVDQTLEQHLLWTLRVID